MKHLAALLAGLTLLACSGEKLTGVSAQDAATRYKTAALASDGTVFLLDGREITREQVDAIDTRTIASIEVLKGGAARAYLKDRAGTAVIVIASKGS